MVISDYIFIKAYKFIHVQFIFLDIQGHNSSN